MAAEAGSAAETAGEPVAVADVAAVVGLLRAHDPNARHLEAAAELGAAAAAARRQP